MKKKARVKKITKFSELENIVAVTWSRAITRQIEESNSSLDIQEHICKDYADNHGITIKRHYRGTLERKKTEELFRQMISEVVAEGDVNVIIVSSLDRISRAGMEVIKNIAYLRSKGIYVICATQPIYPDGSLSEIIFNSIFCNEKEKKTNESYEVFRVGEQGRSPMDEGFNGTARRKQL